MQLFTHCWEADTLALYQHWFKSGHETLNFWMEVQFCTSVITFKLDFNTVVKITAAMSVWSIMTKRSRLLASVFCNSQRSDSDTSPAELWDVWEKVEQRWGWNMDPYSLVDMFDSDTYMIPHSLTINRGRLNLGYERVIHYFAFQKSYFVTCHCSWSIYVHCLYRCFSCSHLNGNHAENVDWREFVSFKAEVV